MDGEKLDVKPIGLSWSGDGFPKEKVPRYEMRISQAATLQDLSEEYAWFSLALMYTKVELMGRDPWGDYLDEQEEDDVFQLTMRFDKPIFRGIEVGADTEFNHVLWAMERDKWKEYCEWMGQVSFIDRDKRQVTRLRTQQVRIADPLYFERTVVLPSNCPTVEVTVFVLDTNRGCIYIQPGAHPLMDLPSVVQSQLSLPDTKVWATGILENHPNPYQLAKPETELDIMAELGARVKQARENDEN